MDIDKIVNDALEAGGDVNTNKSAADAAVKDALEKTGGHIVHEDHKVAVKDLDSKVPGVTGNVVEKRDTYVIQSDAGAAPSKLSASIKDRSQHGEQHTDIHDITKTTDSYSDQIMRADDEGMPPAEIKQTHPSTDYAGSTTNTLESAAAPAHDILSPPPPESLPRYVKLATGDNEKETKIRAEVLETLPPSMHHMRQFDAQGHDEDEQKLKEEHKLHQRNANVEHRVGHMQTLDSGIFKEGEQAVPLSVERKEHYSVTPHYLVDENRDDDINGTQNSRRAADNNGDETSTATSASSFERVESRGSGFDSNDTNNGFEHVPPPSPQQQQQQQRTATPSKSYERNETAEVVEKKRNSRDSNQSREQSSASSGKTTDEQQQRNQSRTSSQRSETHETTPTSPVKKRSSKMEDFNDNTNQRPQWNAAVSQDGAQVTRPEMANLITGLDDDTALRNQYTNVETEQRSVQYQQDQDRGGYAKEQRSEHQQQRSGNNKNNNDDNFEREEKNYAATSRNAEYERNDETNVRQRNAGGSSKQQQQFESREDNVSSQQQQSPTRRDQQQQQQQQQRGGQVATGDQQQQHAEMERLRARVTNSVQDLVMWRDVVHSAVVFAVGFGFFLAVTYMPLTQLLLYVLLIAQVCALALVGLKYLMTKVSNSEFRHPLANVIHSETTINPEPVHRLVDSLLRVVNAQLVQLKRLVLAEDIGTTLKFAATCYALTYFASWFSGLTLIFMFWVGLFTLPKVYTVYQQPIDRNVGHLRNKIGQVEQMLVEKVPQLRPILTGRGPFAMGTRTEQSSTGNVSYNTGSPNRRGVQQQQTTTTTTTSTAVRSSGGNRNR